jgi:hypothetical protein
VSTVPVLATYKLEEAKEKHPQHAQALADAVVWLQENAHPRNPPMRVEHPYSVFPMKGTDPEITICGFEGGYILFFVIRDFPAIKILDIFFEDDLPD